MRRIFFVLFVLFVLFVGGIVYSAKIVDVVGQGSVAITGMTAEQAKVLALQHARSNAIENASGIKVVSNTIVTNGRLGVDLIRTFSNGYIIREEIEWLPLGEYRTDKNSPPIPEYRVIVRAKVSIPDKKENLGLEARLNKHSFISGEKAVLFLKSVKKVNYAIFNLMADDKFRMLYPNIYSKITPLEPNKTIIFPDKSVPYELEMSTIKGYLADAEAFLIIATSNEKIKFEEIFPFGDPISFVDFYLKYSKIAEDCEEVLLPYQVFEK